MGFMGAPTAPFCFELSLACYPEQRRRIGVVGPGLVSNHLDHMPVSVYSRFKLRELGVLLRGIAVKACAVKADCWEFKYEVGSSK